MKVLEDCYMELNVALSFAGCIASYLEHKKNFEQVVFYEDLVKDPAAEMRKFFQTFEIPQVCDHDQLYDYFTFILLSTG